MSNLLKQNCIQIGSVLYPSTIGGERVLTVKPNGGKIFPDLSHVRNANNKRRCSVQSLNECQSWKQREKSLAINCMEKLASESIIFKSYCNFPIGYYAYHFYIIVLLSNR